MAGGCVAILQDLQFDTLENTRKSYARILEAYARSEISERNLRAFTYALSGYLSYWKLEKDIDIERRIEEIEAQLWEENSE